MEKIIFELLSSGTGAIISIVSLTLVIVFFRKKDKENRNTTSISRLCDYDKLLSDINEIYKSYMKNVYFIEHYQNIKSVKEATDGLYDQYDRVKHLYGLLTATDNEDGSPKIYHKSNLTKETNSLLKDLNKGISELSTKFEVMNTNMITMASMIQRYIEKSEALIGNTFKNKDV